MHIVYMGAGFVGACSAAVSADSGHKVLAFDIDAERVRKLSSLDKSTIESCLHEDGLAELIIKHQSRLVFTHDVGLLTDMLEHAEAVFMCLPTPEREDGSSDLTYFTKATEMLGAILVKRNGGAQSQRVLIINKSTVPIDTIDLSKRILEPMGVKNFGIASNPEFLVEGKAVHDSIHPERVIVGAETPEDFATMRRIYQRFVDSSTVQYLEMNPYEAATVKLLSNAALFARLAFTFSTVGRICEAIPNLNYENVRRGIIGDSRIGRWGFYDSLFAGGSCLIKDAESISWQLETHGARADFMRSVLAANRDQIMHFLSRAKTEAGFSFEGKSVALLGLAFKQDTNDMRHSGAIHVLEHVLESGAASVRAWDPAAMDVCRTLFPKDKGRNSVINYSGSAEEAIKGADCVIIATDWPQFRTLGDTILEHAARPCLVMDGRRMIESQYRQLAAAGMSVIAVGSPLYVPG